MFKVLWDCIGRPELCAEDGGEPEEAQTSQENHSRQPGWAQWQWHEWWWQDPTAVGLGRCVFRRAGDPSAAALPRALTAFQGPSRHPVMTGRHQKFIPGARKEDQGPRHLKEKDVHPANMRRKKQTFWGPLNWHSVGLLAFNVPKAAGTWAHRQRWCPFGPVPKPCLIRHGCWLAEDPLRYLLVWL